MKVAQSCPTLCDPMDYTTHGILQARILEYFLFPSPGDLPNPGIERRSPTLLAGATIIYQMFSLWMAKSNFLLNHQIKRCMSISLYYHGLFFNITKFSLIFQIAVLYSKWPSEKWHVTALFSLHRTLETWLSHEWKVSCIFYYRKKYWQFSILVLF